MWGHTRNIWMLQTFWFQFQCLDNTPGLGGHVEALNPRKWGGVTLHPTNHKQSFMIAHHSRECNSLWHWWTGLPSLPAWAEAFYIVQSFPTVVTPGNKKVTPGYTWSMLIPAKVKWWKGQQWIQINQDSFKPFNLFKLLFLSYTFQFITFNLNYGLRNGHL